MRQTRSWHLIPLTPNQGSDPLVFGRLPRSGTYLGVEIAAHGLLSPRLEVKLGSALLLWVTHHVGHGLGDMGGERDRRTDLFPSFTPLMD